MTPFSSIQEEFSLKISKRAALCLFGFHQCVNTEVYSSRQKYKNKINNSDLKRWMFVKQVLLCEKLCIQVCEGTKTLAVCDGQRLISMLFLGCDPSCFPDRAYWPGTLQAG